jgi:hypothetical protein
MKEVDHLDWNIEVHEGNLIIVIKPLQKRLTEF